MISSQEDDRRDPVARRLATLRLFGLSATDWTFLLFGLALAGFLALLSSSGR